MPLVVERFAVEEVLALPLEVEAERVLYAEGILWRESGSNTRASNGRFLLDLLDSQ